MTIHSIPHPGAHASKFNLLSLVIGAFQRSIVLLKKRQARRDAVQHLQGLNEHLLKDIGIDRSEIHEAVKRNTPH